MAQDVTPCSESAERSQKDCVRAFLECLTGPSRGRIVWLSSDHPSISVDEDRMLRILSDATGAPGAAERARLHWSGETYEIEALPRSDIWVNGRKIGVAHLLHGDMIEFGEDGPMSRFRLCPNSFPTRWPVEEILSDAFAYARTSRRPFRSRLTNAIFEGGRRLLLETSLLFRLTVIAVLVVLTAFVALQWRNNRLILHSLEAEALRLEAVAIALAETREQALSADALATLREQLDPQLSSNNERLAVLERRLGTSARVIREATDSVPVAASEGLGLTLSDSALEIGDEVIVMGFPTGLRALLAQAGRDFFTALEQEGDTGFWEIAARLSAQGKIAPLASRGVIAQITPMAVIYDAETTIGGSGGPALDREGNVVAVNAAILPEFGGANIGVPVREVRKLLEAIAAD